MLSENDWKRDPHIVDAYRELVLLMSKENDVPFDEVQGAVEYLLDAIKQCARSNRRQTVLVVDDELGIVEALELILSHACFDVVSAPNGHEALARLKDITPDVVILDLNMPDPGRRGRAQDYARRCEESPNSANSHQWLAGSDGSPQMRRL
jgi:CheY-like chemotaxis protein